jgi:hypothetical protein
MQELLPEIRKMISDGRTHKEIEKELGIEGKQPIHDLLKRERRKERKLADGISSRPKGRPVTSRAKEETDGAKIKRLEMENELLRDFLRAAGRK